MAMRPYEQEGFKWGFFGLKGIKNGEFVGAHGHAPAISSRFHRSIHSCREYAFALPQGKRRGKRRLALARSDDRP
jgi:hypothetical protein